MLLPIFITFLQTTLAIPAGFTTYFYAQQCPSGWVSVPDYQGRLILSVSNGTFGGVKVNNPLADQEDRAHVHSFTTTVTLNSKSVAAIDCCNDEGACHGAYTTTSKTATGTSGVPFTQLIFCQLVAANSNSVPVGTVGFFPPNVTTCPSGWSPYLTANGRFLVPGYSSSGTVESQAAPLASGEDRAHNHGFQTSFHTTDTSYAGVEGCCNSNTAEDTSYNVQGVTDSSSTGIPYIQMLTCVSQNQTFSSQFPSGTLLFNEIACTTGWNVSLEAPGRFLVSLPQGAVPGASFGGRSLQPGYSGPINSSHSFQGDVTTKACGVGLASGCCGNGYAANAQYEYSGVTQEAQIQLPYLAIPQCIQLFDLEKLEQAKAYLNANNMPADLITLMKFLH